MKDIKLTNIKQSKVAIYGILTVIVIFFIFMYMNTALCGVNGDSMYPTLRNGDLLFMSRATEYQRGDIVVLKSTELGSYIVKRVVGISGDEISIRNDGLHLNGELIKESYVSTDDWYKESSKINVTIPEGYVFVMGDNRIGSFDSRDIGLLSVDSIFGVMTYDLSNLIGLSAFGFKVVFILLLVLFVSTFFYPRFKELQRNVKEAAKIAEEKEALLKVQRATATSMTTSYHDTSEEYFQQTEDNGMKTVLRPKE